MKSLLLFCLCSFEVIAVFSQSNRFNTSPNDSTAFNAVEDSTWIEDSTFNKNTPEYQSAPKTNGIDANDTSTFNPTPSPSPFYVDPAQYQPPVRTFSRELLTVKDEKGNVIFEFTQSPCFSTLGYNPEFSQADNLAGYRACESRKRDEQIEQVIPYILSLIVVVGIIWAIIYALNSNKRKWLKLKDHYDTDKDLKMGIMDFMIPDNISYHYFSKNKEADKSSSSDRKKDIVYCTYSFKNYLLDDTFSRDKAFPNWFFTAYPDVYVWFVKNKEHLKNVYKITDNMPINSATLRQLIHIFITEFKNLEVKS